MSCILLIIFNFLLIHLFYILGWLHTFTFSCPGRTYRYDNLINRASCRRECTCKGKILLNSYDFRKLYYWLQYTWKELIILKIKNHLKVNIKFNPKLFEYLRIFLLCKMWIWINFTKNPPKRKLITPLLSLVVFSHTCVEIIGHMAENKCLNKHLFSGSEYFLKFFFLCWNLKHVLYNC